MQQDSTGGGRRKVGAGGSVCAACASPESGAWRRRGPSSGTTRESLVTAITASVRRVNIPGRWDGGGPLPSDSPVCMQRGLAIVLCGRATVPSGQMDRVPQRMGKQEFPDGVTFTTRVGTDAGFDRSSDAE